MSKLLKIAGQCDGVRCDMAMLVLPDVFEHTWGRHASLFWPRAIELVRERVADFCFLAEVYWDLEWTLQQQGFDYTYDKRLYDRLRGDNSRDEGSGLPRTWSGGRSSQGTKRCSSSMTGCSPCCACVGWPRRRVTRAISRPATLGLPRLRHQEHVAGRTGQYQAA